ncbi:Starch-binding associating with outer membrane [Pedobacter steynii]|uniref:Starch-binding associating with outer membrane n=1 Tax=Pedobacter steynii TaxID=430522 RepID=A0A1G9R907_9SPHI|nr:RagB/SusD family nutrient uptake outer membrane protein [Pedobacter steynii]NQX37831.1 RagB/SusD family nutrient uptake outer membrane protein [Pedobacter steynii]SDM19769.1 Starch-binding associating with outer membrane [Pedobacter steynii]
MKKNLNICVVLGLLFVFSACKKSFLDLEPLDTLSTTNSLASTNELRMYMNQFYQGSQLNQGTSIYPETFPLQPTGVGGTGIAFNDAGTDNMIFSAVNTRTSGLFSLSAAPEIKEYVAVRNLNYFFEHFKNAKGNAAENNKFLGEARFFRAYYYFAMLKKIGAVTWVNQVLPGEKEVMEVPRASRTLIVDSVLADLDQAVTLLPSVANSASMRVHKDVALAFKSRVALYEATWEKYHKAKNDPFFTKDISAEKIQNYFEQARDAASAVMTGNKWSVYTTGKPLEDYGNLFMTTDLSANPEILFWKKYNANENIAHSVSKYTSTGGADLGLTLSLVDDYLTRDGRPFLGTERADAQKIYAKELSPLLRDPRLGQTIAVPGKPLKPGVVVPGYPPINQTGFNKSTTGYPLYKFLEYNNAAAVSDDFKSVAPAIVFRYAEVLLNYAEAVAELGGDPGSIANALNPLRTRAGMPAVDFNREYNTDASYPFRNLGSVIQAVRRERRVELAAEGMRLDDIMRWAAADELLIGKRQLGTLFVGSDMTSQNVTGGFYGASLLYYDTAPAGKSVNLYLNGNAGDGLRYIDPFKSILPNGSGFNPQRDYLLPIQQRMVQLTGGKWIQNPGW